MSWENDGDHYNTETVYTDDLVRAMCLHNFALLFKRDDIGNFYDPREEEREFIYQEFNDFYNSNPGLMYPTDYMDSEEILTPLVIAEIMMEEAGALGLVAGEFFTRRCESVQVTYSPIDLMVEVL